MKSGLSKIQDQISIACDRLSQRWAVSVRRLHPGTHSGLIYALLLLASTATGTTQAEVQAAYPDQPSWTDEELAAAQRIRAQQHPAVELRRTYALGVNKYALDHATRVTGWEVAEGVYFGRAKGEDSGLALVWQRKRNQQVSLSNDGLRFTRRF